MIKQGEELSIGINSLEAYESPVIDKKDMQRLQNSEEKTQTLCYL